MCCEVEQMIFKVDRGRFLFLDNELGVGRAIMVDGTKIVHFFASEIHHIRLSMAKRERHCE